MPETIDGKTIYPMNDEKFTAIMKSIMDKYPVSMAGGCCGTDKTHIKMLSEMAKDRPVPKREEKPYYGEAASLFTAVRRNI